MIFIAETNHADELVKIFWETASKTEFANPQERLSFQKKYFDIYLQHPRAINFYARPNNELLGYIFCIGNTASEPDILEQLPFMQKFNQYFEKFPAHLHINLTANARNQGLGSSLLRHLEQNLKQRKINGVHLLTAPQGRNVSFYSKNGYEKIEEIEGILMLGKSFE